MRVHLPTRDRGLMAPAPVPYLIRVKGHLGATVLSAFPAMTPQRQGPHTVLTGLLDRSALYGALAVIEALGLDLLEVQRLTPGTGTSRPTVTPCESPESGDGRSPG
jgi:hypothetical protein